MRILVVDELCYPQVGGIQVRFKALAERWVTLGNTVYVTAIDHIGDQPTTETINGVVYNRVIQDSNYYKNGPFGRKISTIIKYSFKLAPYLRQDWDLIVFCQFPMLPEVFYKYFFKKRAKTVLDFVEYRDSKLWKIINKIILNSADKVVCISEHVKNCATIYRKEDLHVVPSFFDTSVAVSKSKSNYIFLGRMVEHKHPEHAIEAVIEYNKSYNKSIQLSVVGGGSMLTDLKKKYDKYPAITFFGSVSDDEKRCVLENGRVLILPSEREGLPIVVIESMAYGIPTITTNYSGNGAKYFVEEEEIGLVSVPEIKSLAAKIAEMEENYDSFVSKCEQIKPNYDSVFVSKNYLELFR